MSKTNKDSINFTIEPRDIGYMMATKAFHLMGDISSDEPDLCHIYGVTSDNPHAGYYVGAWETGYGCINVLFPKESTRPLTDDEVAYWSGRKVQIGNQIPWGFNADDLRASREYTNEHPTSQQASPSGPSLPEGEE